MEFSVVRKSAGGPALCLMGLLLVAFAVSYCYRGIYSDDTMMYLNRADQIYFAQHLRGGETLSVASILYAALIALGYVFVGQTLLATHLFPFLLAVLIPVLFFLVLRRMSGHDGWALLGALLYLFYPTNIVWLNQNLTEPVFVFCLMLALLTLEYAKAQPKFLIGVGFAAALLMLARLFDGAVFAALLGLAVIYQQRQRFPAKWCLCGVGAFIGVHLVCALLLRYSPVEYYHYFQQMFRHDNVAVNYLGELSPQARTIMAVKTYLRWYLGGSWMPIFMLLIGIGTLTTLRRHDIYPLLCVSGYTAFLFVGLGGRDLEPLLTRLSVKILPALVILLICGAKTMYDWMAGVFSKKWNTRWPAHLFVVLFALGFGWFSFQRNQAFFTMMAEIIPSASLGQIARQNFEFAAIYAAKPQNVREEVYKQVLGAYRPAYRSALAQQAFDAHIPQQQQKTADFAYQADFQDPAKWQAELWERSGNSALWHAQYPGHIGAFPYRAEGTIIYEFSFPRPIKELVLSDMHTQWTPGDIVRLWTSRDGRAWVLRYDDPLRYQPTYYHQAFTAEFAGAQAVYVKYYFYAGDPERGQNDNRGAALQEFFVAATFETPQR